jgi:DNA-binding transcriptional MerR regulator
MPLTVSEIAHRLAEPERRNALRERIRHWTREGLVKPIGEKNPGTGRHRLYEESVLVDVAILNALAGLGIQVRAQHEVLFNVKKYLKDWPKEWDQAAKDDYNLILLELSNVGGDEPRVRLQFVNLIDRSKGAYKMYPQPNATASLYINVTRIQAQLSSALSPAPLPIRTGRRRQRRVTSLNR